MEARQRWWLLSLGLVSAIAAFDAWVDTSAVSVSFLLLGPLLAAGGLDGPRTAIVALYAEALAIALGVPDHIFGSGDHLRRCLLVAVAGCFAVYTAHTRTRREAQLGQLTRVAEAVQRALLRPVPARIGGVALAARYHSAAQEAMLGGDFYDTAFTPYGLRVILGDVKGKGLDAVEIAAVVLGAFREAAFAQPDLVALMTTLDRRSRAALQEEDFVTVVVAEFAADGAVSLVNCGHPAPLLVHHDGMQPLAPASATTPLGLEPVVAVQRVGLAPGERLLLYTDGLVEARDAHGRMFSLDSRVEACLTAQSLDTALDGVLRLVLAHTGARLDDDLALLIAESLPTPTAELPATEVIPTAER
jgi:sigma-B regulation protein RsbU (phosphoserine phosphatase)